MAYSPLSTVPIQYSKTDGTPANGYYLKFYVANSSTPIGMQTDSGGATSLAKCKLNESGYPISNPNDENTVFIPHLSTTYTAYRFVLYASAADADANNVTSGLPNIQSVEINAAITASDAAADDLRADLAANSGSSLVGFLQAGTGSVARTVQSKMRDMISVKDFGAVGNGEADDTDAIQAALDAAPDKSAIYFPAGVYSVRNITIPNKFLTFFGDGQWETILQARSGISNSNYLIASATYVNNATSGSLPIIVYRMGFDGSTYADNVFVLYGFYSELIDCQFTSPNNAGAALLLTSDGISGAACSSTLVENKVLNCRMNGGGSGAASFNMTSSGQKLTDMMFIGNVAWNGNATFTAMAGHNVSSNHFYGSAVYFNRLSIGTIISKNYFEDTVSLGDFVYPIVTFDNNSLLARLTIGFGNSGETIVLNNNNFQSTADIFHNYFAANKHVVVNGGSFVTGTPVVFSNGSSTGRVTFNRVYNYTLGYELDGSRTAATGRIAKVFWDSAAPTTGTWDVGDIIWNTSPAAAGYIGWVCTTVGTPGTWKTFGNITP